MKLVFKKSRSNALVLPVCFSLLLLCCSATAGGALSKPKQTEFKASPAAVSSRSSSGTPSRRLVEKPPAGVTLEKAIREQEQLLEKEGLTRLQGRERKIILSRLAMLTLYAGKHRRSVELFKRLYKSSSEAIYAYYELMNLSLVNPKSALSGWKQYFIKHSASQTGPVWHNLAKLVNQTLERQEISAAAEFISHLKWLYYHRAYYTTYLLARLFNRYAAPQQLAGRNQLFIDQLEGNILIRLGYYEAALSYFNQPGRDERANGERKKKRAVLHFKLGAFEETVKLLQTYPLAQLKAVHLYYLALAQLELKQTAALKLTLQALLAKNTPQANRFYTLFQTQKKAG